MAEPDLLSSDIASLMAEQREAWRELTSPALTQFDRREIRNRIKRSEVELRECLIARTEWLLARPRRVEPVGDSLASINFRLF